MRKVLKSEIVKEKCNAAALGMFNSAVDSVMNETETVKNNSNFNEDFYKSDRSYTREIAEQKMKEAGINLNDVQFVNVSYSNGASFYYQNKKTGEKIRVSNHSKTGMSAGEYRNISLLNIYQHKGPKPFALRDMVNNGEISFKEYKKKVKEYGYTMLVKKDPLKN